MKKFLLSMFALLIMGGANLKAENAGLSDLEAAYGATSDWLSSVPTSYPVNVLDATIFGSDADSQTTNANVNNYDYIYFEVTDFVSARAVRVFFWDPAQNKRLNYYLKPVADKETADYESATTVSAAGTYCVKIPDGARLQGAKTPWIENGATDPYFKFSAIYLTERATPYVELVPYTLVWTPNAGSYRATIPISESHIRATGNVSINYTTGEVTCTGSGALTIYLNKENLVGATGYNLVTADNALLGSTLDITDEVNGEVGGLYGSRNSWHIAGDASRKNKVGAVTAFKYNFSAAGSWTITSIYFDANQLIAETTNKNLADMPYGRWGAPASVVSQYIDVDSYKTNNIGQGANSMVYGHDGNSDAHKYVDLTNCTKMTITGLSSNAQIRLFYNWSGTNDDKPIEILGNFPKDASGTYVFDIEAFKKAKGITFFHLNGIKAAQGQTATISAITVDEYTNVISGAGIDRTKNYLLNPYLTSIDATGITAATELSPANPNCLITANAGMVTNSKNVIVDGTCANLVLADNYPFQAPSDFTATSASYTTTINASAGAATLCLPFAATIPDGVTAYTLTYTSGDYATATPVETTIPANTPVLINGSGEVTFTGTSAAIDADATNTSGALTGVFAAGYVPANSYVLQKQDENVGFYKVADANTITVKPFRAYLTAQGAGAKIRINFQDESSAINAVENDRAADKAEIFNMAGQRVNNMTRGLYIVNGKKVLVK